MANLSTPSNSRADQELGRPGVILVVDDDPLIRRVIRETLEGEGFDVSTSGDPNEAIEMVTRLDPSLAILDVHLPHMRGERLARQLVTRTRRRFPIVTITSDDRVAESARAMHAVAYLRKPFDLVDLVAVVQGVLAAERSRVY
jgi:CheY-like chemotaxis protein